MKTNINRRSFLSKSARAGAGLLILRNSRLALAYDANSKLNIAGIGVGGQGRGSLDAFHGMGNNLVALCDVDAKRAGDIYQKHPGAKRYQDFREMFDQMEKQIDAVLVATPDHTHAVAAVGAMKLGKHVYCEKPLTRTVHEARVMRETAARHDVVTQMGKEGYPISLKVVMDLPARGALPPVKLTWYAKEKPPEDLMLGYKRGGWGDLLVGSKGSIYSDNPWNANYVLLPEKQFEDFKGGPPESLPRVQSQQGEWFEACKGNGKTFSGFDVGGPLTELAQLANLGTLVEGPLEFDTLSGKILNSEPASNLLHRKYRKGWSL